MNEIFNKLNGINVNEHTEKKNGLTYLSWAWAWAELKKVYPEVTYEIKMFDGKPYIYDENLGYMVMTSVTVDGLTYDMWLPVMDGNNKAMKTTPYIVKTKYKEIEVAAATMFDVNKAIMRCLVKNLAMFGLGLYIYSGEDLPEEEAEAAKKPARKFPMATPPEPKGDNFEPLNLVCEECGKAITPTTDKDGNEMSALTVATIARARTKRTLCAACTKAALK